MPTPQPNESRRDFVARCIPEVIADGTAQDENQAVAVCNSMWENRSQTMDTILEYNNDRQLDLWNDGNTLIGYASVFYREGDPDTEYQPFDGFVERVQPGAFRQVIARGDDVWAAVNHNMERILGRRGANTLVLEEDEIGLRYSVDLPDTTEGRDIRVQVKRGDFTGSSIGFVPAADGVERTKEADVTVRTITNVAVLRDVGPVHTPAFKGTTVSARCRHQLFQEEFNRQQREIRAQRIAALKKEIMARSR